MYVYQEYPRDLKNADGTIREFKTKESVPPGWRTRDTDEEINPATDAKRRVTGVKNVTIETTP
jgi:hypothetical protein